MRKQVTRLLILISLVLGAALAQTPAIDAQKAEVNRLVEQMRVAGSTEEYNQLLELYNRAVAEVERLKAAEAAAGDEETACKSSINEANARYKENDFAGSREAAQRAVELCPDQPKPFYLLGVTEKRLGNHRQALEAFKGAIQADSNYVLAWYELGRLYAKQLQQVSKGLEILDRLLAIDPGYVKAYYEKGQIFSRQKNHSAAATSFRAAVDLDPGYTKAWDALANSYLELKNCRKALEAVDGALAEQGFRNLSQVYYHQAMAFNQCGRFAQTLEAVDNCLSRIRRQTGNKSFIQGGAWYEKGTALERMERYTDALQAFEAAGGFREWRQQAQYEIDRIKREQGI